MKNKKTQLKRETLKVCLVGSSGGHLSHLYMLKPFWKNKDRFWVTFDKEDARSLLEGEKMYPCYYPSNRSIKALLINAIKAIKILSREKPNLIISSGVFDRIDAPTLAGKLCYPVSDKFIVQWEEMKKIYPKAINLGSIF